MTAYVPLVALSQLQPQTFSTEKFGKSRNNCGQDSEEQRSIAEIVEITAITLSLSSLRQSLPTRSK